MPPKKKKGGISGTAAPTPATGSGLPGTPDPSVPPSPAPLPPPSLAETLSYLHEPRPFKNPYYTKNHNRRAKNLKAVLNAEREKIRQDRERLKSLLEYEARMREKDKVKAENGDNMDVDGDRAKTGEEEEEEAPPPMTESERRAIEEDTSYLATEAAPSILPHPKYCDITGLEGPYTDPKTRLRYHDKSVYEIIQGLNLSTIGEYLSLRGAAPIVK